MPKYPVTPDIISMCQKCALFRFTRKDVPRVPRKIYTRSTFFHEPYATLLYIPTEQEAQSRDKKKLKNLSQVRKRKHGRSEYPSVCVYWEGRGSEARGEAEGLCYTYLSSDLVVGSEIHSAHDTREHARRLVLARQSHLGPPSTHVHHHRL